jgi:hypothetical protein
MIILGIDPGYAIVGYGAIEYMRGRFRVLGYGAITTEAGIPTVDDVGVEGFYIHSVKECALLSSLAHSAKLLASVAYCI